MSGLKGTFVIIQPRVSQFKSQRQLVSDLTFMTWKPALREKRKRRRKE